MFSSKLKRYVIAILGLQLILSFFFGSYKSTSIHKFYSEMFDLEFEQNTTGTGNDLFKRYLARRFSLDENFVILVMTDNAFTDMAISLYETSFKRHNITNFLFVGVGETTCETLGKVSLPCFHYTNDHDSESSSVYGSPEFIRKMNIRTDMVLDALRAGFTVLHMDLDVVFLKNPLPDLQVVTRSADIATLFDDSTYNAGFLVIRPTVLSIQLYEKIKRITDSSRVTDDQEALCIAIEAFKRKYSSKGFSVMILDSSKYLCGLAYYEQGNRLFPADCSECIVAHNNWIVSREAKIYRFKEHLHWMYDGDSYYTSTTRKYLLTSNPIVWDSQLETEKEELDALKAALAIGAMLNRIVILPRFHCSWKECPLNSLLSMVDFDKIFAGKYRESSFLQHPWVPDAVKFKGYLSNAYVISTRQNQDVIGRLSSNEYKFINFSNTDVVEESEFKKQFLDLDQETLEFSSLYRVSCKFSNEAVQTEFENDIKRAFQRTDYRQQIKIT